MNMNNKRDININHVDKSGCFTARKLDNGTLQIACVVIDLDERIHTDERPFCSDPLCPCHHDPNYKWEHVGQFLVAGKLTEDEAVRLFSGQSLNVADDDSCIVEYPLGQPHRQHEDWQDYM